MNPNDPAPVVSSPEPATTPAAQTVQSSPMATPNPEPLAQTPPTYQPASSPSGKSRKPLKIFTIAVVIILVLFGILYALGIATSKKPLSEDSVKVEALVQAKKELGQKVSSDKTIPDSIATQDGVSYMRVDNQKAELCATFSLPRSGANDSVLSPVDLFQEYFGTKNTDHQIYRDNVDFAQHASGRNCYIINYAPINVGYESGPGGVCDLKRSTSGGRFTGLAIKGFIIGGPFTTEPGDNNTRLVLSQDADAFDSTCKKIPLSAIKVGDKVDLYNDNGPVYGSVHVYYVKVIKKEF